MSTDNMIHQFKASNINFLSVFSETISIMVLTAECIELKVETSLLSLSIQHILYDGIYCMDNACFSSFSILHYITAHSLPSSYMQLILQLQNFESPMEAN